MKADFKRMLTNAKTLSDIFEVVKTAVWQTLGRNRGGLMLGLADLGNHPQGVFGAFHPIGTNIIVLNKVPLMRIKETNPELYNSYVFHVLTHEYLHTLGFLDEKEVRQATYAVSCEIFGKDHPVTCIASDTTRFFPNLTYPNISWQPNDLDIELVEKFDRSSVTYIA